jgi:hypothetical protein
MSLINGRPPTEELAGRSPGCKASRSPRLRRGTASHITTCLTAPPRPENAGNQLGRRPTGSGEPGSHRRSTATMNSRPSQIRPHVARQERARCSGAARAGHRRRLEIELRAGAPARHSSVDTSAAPHLSAPRSLTRQGTEPYVSRVQMAQIMAVSLATLDRMVAEGMPSVTCGRRTRRFRPSVAIAWAQDRKSA